MVKPHSHRLKAEDVVDSVLLLGFAIAIIAAINPLGAHPDPNFSGVNLYSYFTVQSNLIAAATFLIGAVALWRRHTLGKWFATLRLGAVLYMVVTGIVYALLLKNNTQANTALAFNWPNFILHEAAPMFIVAEWLLWPRGARLTLRQSLLLLIFPVVWLIYTVIRAQFTDWYPYPFLDPATAGGAMGATLHIIAIAIGFFGLCLMMSWVSRVRVRQLTSR